MPAPTVTANPSYEAVEAGDTATLTAAASGGTAVQWEVSTDGGTTYCAILGATSPTYSFQSCEADNDNLYKAVFVNTAGSTSTAPVSLNVQQAALPIVSIFPYPSPDGGSTRGTSTGGSATGNFRVTLTDSNGNPWSWTGSQSLTVPFQVSTSGNPGDLLQPPTSSLVSPIIVTFSPGQTSEDLDLIMSPPSAQQPTVWGQVELSQPSSGAGYIVSSTHYWAIHTVTSPGQPPLICPSQPTCICKYPARERRPVLTRVRSI